MQTPSVTYYTRPTSPFYYARWKDADGKPRREATEIRVDDPDGKRQIEARCDAIKYALKTGERVSTAPVTVAEFVATWIARRRESNPTDNMTYTIGHCLAHIGAMEIAGVRPRHLVDMVTAWRASGAAPRTVWNQWAAVRLVFRDAVVAEHVSASPCTLPFGTLPPRQDKDPTRKRDAWLRPSEVQALLTDARVSDANRVLWACKILTGARHSDVIAWRWRDIDWQATPLPALTFQIVKTSAPAAVPIHPALAGILRAWRERTGASDADYIIPRVGRKPLDTGDACTMLASDLAALGITRVIKGHDLRATLITNLEEAGVDSSIIKLITHPRPSGDAYSGYARGQRWQAKCEAIMAFPIPSEHTPSTLTSNSAVSLGLDQRSVFSGDMGQGGASGGQVSGNATTGQGGTGHDGASRGRDCVRVSSVVASGKITITRQGAILAAMQAADAAADAARAAADTLRAHLAGELAAGDSTALTDETTATA